MVAILKWVITTFKMFTPYNLYGKGYLDANIDDLV